MLIVLFRIPCINKFIIIDDDDKLITTNIRKVMTLFDNILQASVDEIIIFNFRSDLPSKANNFTSMGLKVTLHYQQSMIVLLLLRKSIPKVALKSFISITMRLLKIPY